MKKILGILVLLLAVGLVSCGSDSEDKAPAPAGAATLFTLDDSANQNVTGVQIKGSTLTAAAWDLLDMYDDGTHGDVTANDHIWSLSIVISKSGSWGCMGSKDGAASGWLLVGDNPEYTYDATANTVSGKISYAIPFKGPSMDVTFTIDDSIGKGLTNVQLQGSMTSWASKAMTETAAGSGIWTVTLTAVESGNWGFVYGTAGTWGLDLVDKSLYTTADNGNIAYTVTAGTPNTLSGTTSIAIKSGVTY